MLFGDRMDGPAELFSSLSRLEADDEVD
jgi:hypothetical protein